MAKIKISDLHPTGYELFSDSESYMNELGDRDLNLVNGGTSPIIRSLATASRAVARGVSYLYSVAARNTPRISNYDPGRTMPGASFG